MLFGRVNGGRSLAHPLQAHLGREKWGEQLKGLRATPDRQTDRQTDTQFKMPPSAQHSFGFWCPDSLTLSFSANSSTTPSTNHRADLYEKNSTLLVQLVSPIDEILSPVQTSMPGHAACRALFENTASWQRGNLPPQEIFGNI